MIEKEVEYDLRFITSDSDTDAQELAQYNPSSETPTLADRELSIYEAQIINEYLDERLPHPPLMPVDPVNRGKARLLAFRIVRDWIQPIRHIDSPSIKPSVVYKQTLRGGLLSLSPMFKEQPYILGEDYSIVDCLMAPLLWRLPSLGITLPKQARSVIEYSERLFKREAFQMSLTETELGLR